MEVDMGELKRIISNDVIHFCREFVEQNERRSR